MPEVDEMGIPDIIRLFVSFVIDNSEAEFSDEIYNDLRETTLDIDVEILNICHYTEACNEAMRQGLDPLDINDRNYEQILSFDDFIKPLIDKYHMEHPEMFPAKQADEMALFQLLKRRMSK